MTIYETGALQSALDLVANVPRAWKLGSLETAHYFEVTIALSPAALGQNTLTQDFSKDRLSFTFFISPADTMSFVESLQAAQQTLSTALAQQASPFIVNQHKIAQCIALMSDELSRVNYQSEISYLMLRDINKPLAAQISPFTEADWQHVVERWQGFVKSPECPKMVCAQGEQGYMANMLMTTFIAGQYRYNDEVKVAKDEIFVDCGACFGDTALWAYQQGAAEVYTTIRASALTWLWVKPKANSPLPPLQAWQEPATLTLTATSKWTVWCWMISLPNTTSNQPSSNSISRVLSMVL